MCVIHVIDKISVFKIHFKKLPQATKEKENLIEYQRVVLNIRETILHIRETPNDQ